MPSDGGRRGNANDRNPAGRDILTAPRTLVLDTATAACSVALLEDGRVVDRAHEVVGRGHAERLVPMIAALQDGGRADRILVDCGPGSFTGVRVGLAAARGLAIGWGVPVMGYSSLALIAASAFARDDAERLAVAIPGGHGELFVQSFSRGPRAEDVLRSLAPERAAGAIDAPLVIGGGAAALIAVRGSGEARDALPDAADALLLPADLATLPAVPLYGRAPDARVPA